ncbi:Putative lipoprotein [Leptospira santarosai]|uniref:Lipoprotein n=1 Tax=Leptospira santarosai TaxID=28183 RepID=A0A2P1QR24_9LEPT|nr:Putative lipoprotein [Leptospira santarosai]
MKINVLLISSFLFVFTFFSSCSNEKEDKKTSDFLLLLLLPDRRDRAENYDRDVQIITHTIIASPGVSYDVNYTDEDLNYYKNLVETEIARYPRGYLIKARAEKIVFTRNLSIGSLGYRGALARPEENTIFLDVQDGLKSRSIFNPAAPWTYYSEERLSNGIHHELTHSMDGTMGYWWDPKWESLNPPSFQYGSYDYSSFNPRALGAIPPILTPFWNPIDGFVSEYATSNFAEDRADVGAAIQGRQFSYLNEICATDPIVAAKVRLTIDEMNHFWPFPGAEDTQWKRRFSEIRCN